MTRPAPPVLRRSIVPFVCDLMRKNYEAVGFLPQSRIEHYVERGQVLVSTEGGDMCGFLVFGSNWPATKVYQTCVDFDARRLDHATKLVSKLEMEAARRGSASISLWCAADLDANSFWRACGFSPVGRRLGGARRQREHINWVKWLSTSPQMDLLIGDGSLAELAP